MSTALLFTNQNQSIGIAGALTDRPNDSLVLNTANVVLEQFNPLLRAIKLKLEGVLNGRVTIHDPKHFAFSSDLSFEHLKINNNTLGEMVVKTNYDAKTKTIKEQIGEDQYNLLIQTKKLKQMIGIPQTRLPFEYFIQ